MKTHLSYQNVLPSQIDLICIDQRQTFERDDRPILSAVHIDMFAVSSGTSHILGVLRRIFGGVGDRGDNLSECGVRAFSFE
jgi:hypothetical protein